MNAIDLLVAIPILWGFWRGFMKGAIMEAALLVAFFLGLWGGTHLSDWMAGILRGWMDSESPYIPLISFALVFVGILIGVYAVAKLVERVVENAALSMVNKIVGGALGAGKFLLVISVLFFVLDAAEEKMSIIPPKMKDESLLYRPVAAFAPMVLPGLRETQLGKMIPGKEDLNIDLKVKVKDQDSLTVPVK